jgi:hypothetical protein
MTGRPGLGIEHRLPLAGRLSAGLPAVVGADLANHGARSLASQASSFTASMMASSPPCVVSVESGPEPNPNLERCCLH